MIKQQARLEQKKNESGRGRNHESEAHGGGSKLAKANGAKAGDNKQLKYKLQKLGGKTETKQETSTKPQAGDFKNARKIKDSGELNEVKDGSSSNREKSGTEKKPQTKLVLRKKSINMAEATAGKNHSKKETFNQSSRNIQI